MKRIITILTVVALLMLSAQHIEAQFTNIAVTGFNQDVVADGTATSTTTTTSDLDGYGYILLSSDYNPGGNGVCFPNNSWSIPDYSINSLITPCLTYSLQPANVNNALLISGNGSPKTLTLATPMVVSTLYVLYMCSTGYLATTNVTVTFDDNSTQVVTSDYLYNWCSGSAAASSQVYRTTQNTDNNCNAAGNCPYFSQFSIDISPANYNKMVTSVTFTSASDGSILSVFALGGKIAQPCVTPTNQPTALTFTPGISSISGSFATASCLSNADHYLIVRTTTDTLNAFPVNGNIYNTGDIIGNATVIAYQTQTTFNDYTLANNTVYYYHIFSVNSNCIGVANYLTTNPLTDSTSLWNGGFTSSNLPIIVINTNNVDIPDSPKIPAHMGIIYNGEGFRNYMTDPFNNYNNNIGIEIRGSSSQMFPQKSYGLETRDVNQVQQDTIVLGMPADNDWILYAPYDDKSCMRNTLTYDIANKTGHYAVRTKFCELIINGRYQGIYIWMEKIKRGADRVNISKLEVADSTGDNLTGGYIIKIDKSTGSGGWDGWDSQYLTDAGNTIHFLYDYPKSTDIIAQQQAYIASYLDSFETALKVPNWTDPVNGYRKYMDVNSFVDYFIANELSKNVDGLRLSTYLYKNKYSHGGKIVAGPVWDYNIAYGNVDYGDCTTSYGWAYQTVENATGAVPFWWDRLMQDPVYKSTLKCRWAELRQTVLSTTAINHYIDSIVTIISEAQQRHFVQWPVLGVYTWPNPDPIPTSFAGEITALKTWIQSRIAWLDAAMPGSNALPVVNLGNDTVACPGQVVLNAGNPYATYLWNTGDTTQTITINTSGTYTVIVNKNYGCRNSDTITVTMKPIPYAFAGNDTAICQGNSIALHVVGEGNYAFYWNHNVFQGEPFVPITTQYYTATVIGSNACTNKDSILVSLIPLPAKPSITAILGINDTLISNATVGNQWYKDGVLLMGENGQKLLISSFVSGTYTVVVTDATGCSSEPADAYTIVSIKENANNCSFNVYPNPSNAIFNLTSVKRHDKPCKVVIYNYMGKVVNQFDWNGDNTTINLTDQASGVYMMIINDKDTVEVKKLLLR